MTTSTIPLDLPKQIVVMFSKTIEESTKQTAHWIWDILIFFLKEYWLGVLLLIFVVFVYVTLKAMMGRWGSLGSFIYNFLYFGTLFVIGLIWGPEVFVNDFFNAACAIILYPICYIITGRIFDKFGVRRFRRRA